MPWLQIYLDKEIKAQVQHYKVDNEFPNDKDTISDILYKFFNMPKSSKSMEDSPKPAAKQPDIHIDAPAAAEVDLQLTISSMQDIDALKSLSAYRAILEAQLAINKEFKVSIQGKRVTILKQ